MNLTQPLCNAAAATKLCEVAILDGESCVNTIARCRSMTFEKDNLSPPHRYEEYVSDTFMYSDFFPNDTKFHNQRSILEYCVLILLFLLIQ